MMFGLVALPFTLLTTMCRVHILALNIAFLEPEWTTILLAGLILANVVMIWACRKSKKYINGQVMGLRNEEPIIQPVRTAGADDLNLTCSEPGSQNCLNSCCCTQWMTTTTTRRTTTTTTTSRSLPTPKSGKYILTKDDSSDSCWTGFGQLLCLSVPSIIIPTGYSNDYKSHHPRIKGGLYLILNYLVNMSILGVTLGYVVLHRIPNDIHGLTISNPAIGVNVPSSKIVVDAGVKLAFNLPQQNINLGTMPSMDASFNMEDIDTYVAIILPIIFAAACLPFVVMRAAMMELDCFITRRKQLGDDFDDLVVLEGVHNRRKNTRKHIHHQPMQNNRRFLQNQSLAEILASNAESKELKCRLYLSLICSGFGIIVMTLYLMALGAFFAMQFMKH